MFTGIIEAVSPILGIKEGAGRRLFRIRRPQQFEDIKASSSIACDGICLTVLQWDSDSFEVEVMNETLSKTTAGSWKNGQMLNLERAMQLGGRLDGHLVQGHIDRVSRLQRIQKKGQTLYLWFDTLRDDAALLVPQGSIAINGVSLTIAGLNSLSFAVALISHTTENSNLSSLKQGQEVNLEYDVIGKYIMRRDLKQDISKGWLNEHGF